MYYILSVMLWTAQQLEPRYGEEVERPLRGVRECAKLPSVLLGGRIVPTQSWSLV